FPQQRDCLVPSHPAFGHGSLLLPGPRPRLMPPGLPPGPEGVRKFFKEILGSVFSDLKIDIEFMLAEGDKVDCHFVVTVKHIGDFAGIKAKGNLIRLSAISTFRIENGKLAEAWEIYDKDSLLQQMRA
ncbi:MAG: ester cyclase, partial [Verrucomicrobiae bacterium]|nr:ester cyclase [Verrucomicrobiae bacterium]